MKKLVIAVALIVASAAPGDGRRLSEPLQHQPLTNPLEGEPP